MPFAMNEATQFINPTKALEYMATGRPIVSTPVEDVVTQFGDVVTIAQSASEFIRSANVWPRTRLRRELNGVWCSRERIRGNRLSLN